MKAHRKKAHRINAVEKENPTFPMLPSRLRVLTPEPYDVILDGTISREHAEQLLRSRQAKLMAGGRAVRLIVYHEMPEHPCRTRISVGGLMAALGMSQVYTIANERGGVHDFKRIYPEDRACFHQATNPGGWMMVLATAGLVNAATAFSILREAAAIL